MTQSVSGIILAGGQSKRMGRDKAHMSFKGKSLLDHSIDIIKNFCSDILVCANDPSLQIDMDSYADIIPDSGPLGGIYTGLSYIKNDRAIVLACDTPLISKEIIEHLLKNSGDADITVATYQNNIEPLCGIYNRSTSIKIESLIKEGKIKMHDVLKEFNTNYIDVASIANENSFVNLNDISTFERIEKT